MSEDQVETRYLLNPDQQVGEEEPQDPMAEGFDSMGNEQVVRRAPGRVPGGIPMPTSQQLSQNSSGWTPEPPPPIWQQRPAPPAQYMHHDGGVQQDLDQVMQETRDETQVLDEAERRFELAAYYKTILHDPLFPEANSEAAQIVETEMREFARDRLQILLGMKAEGGRSLKGGQFSEDEAQRLGVLVDPQVFEVLLALIAKLTGKPAILSPSASAPPAPAPRPAPPKVAPRQVQPPPQVRRPQQQAAQPRQLPKPAPVPARRPVLPKPLPKVPQQQQAAVPQRPEPPKGVGVPVGPEGPPIKLLHNQEPPMNQRYIDPNDGRIKKRVVNEEGKVVTKDLTQQVRPIHMAPLPIPTPEQWETISRHQANAAFSKQHPIINGAIALTVGGGEDN